MPHKRTSKKSTFKAVIDTNVLYSGILYEGVESDILDNRAIELYISEYILKELLHVFRKKGLPADNLKRFIQYSNIRIIADGEYEKDENFKQYLEKAKLAVADPKDRPIFVFAKYAQKKDPNTYFITGDEHLLTAEAKKELRGQAMKPREFTEKIRL